MQVGFLMVGHTHEDIDQYFSKLSQYLKYNSAHTLPGIIGVHRNTFLSGGQATPYKFWLYNIAGVGNPLRYSSQMKG